MSESTGDKTKNLSVIGKIRVIRTKYLTNTMISSTVLPVMFLAGMAVACLISVLPTVLLSLLSDKRQLTSTVSQHDTSVMLRVRQHILPPSPEVMKEAIQAMNLAMDMEAQGKHEKATRLYEHALKLDPSHADILTTYGEFLEKHQKNIVKAEHMYRMALEICPEHNKALANRERILPLVEEIDLANFKRIDKKLDAFIRVPLNHPGLRRAKKEAYFSHIYHTNAIEGNTLTLLQTRAIVETRLAVGGKSLVEQNEVLGLDAALKYINNTLCGRLGEITLDDILQIHNRVLGFVDPTESGRIRLTQVFVGNFQPPAPAEVPKLMNEFVIWLNSEEAVKLHPIEQAALAHFKLVVIHPFYDGNGRTSRLLMNLILMQAGYPPVSIKVEDRLKYYETLEKGNDGDVRPFIRFVADCTERTLDEYILATSENPSALGLNTSENVIPFSDI
ncbi:adenosine monophosphate-protein transferase FICD-like [Mizuhopecten yessoensis]|uniref:protein adenylyltransferase n=2 Tax=Mizuhopecten yessoensis TaxID=6573 RepID=A0A210R0G8_MIZYE|nr:adenosine monophosphate-protein transferase FICD-like [Mizuhopecten yessoensis]OWF54510.1 Adenosine monophosphate-protein transferase FICD [Mizuhopecten yessoensis]